MLRTLSAFISRMVLRCCELCVGDIWMVGIFLHHKRPIAPSFPMVGGGVAAERGSPLSWQSGKGSTSLVESLHGGIGCWGESVLTHAFLVCCG